MSMNKFEKDIANNIYNQFVMACANHLVDDSIKTDHEVNMTCKNFNDYFSTFYLRKFKSKLINSDGFDYIIKSINTNMWDSYVEFVCVISNSSLPGHEKDEFRFVYDIDIEAFITGEFDPSFIIADQ